MPPTYKLKEHARAHRNRTKIDKLKEHAAAVRRQAVSPKAYSPPVDEYNSPPYTDADAEEYVPESPPYAPVASSGRRSALRGAGAGAGGRRRRVSHSDLKEVQEFELENEVDDSGNVHRRWFHPQAIFSENPGLMKARTGAVVGQEPQRSRRYMSTEARMTREHGPCTDEDARRELVRVLDLMHGVRVAMEKHALKIGGHADLDDINAYFDLQLELVELTQQKHDLFVRCGYNPALAFGRLEKAAHKTKSAHKRKKYHTLMNLLML